MRRLLDRVKRHWLSALSVIAAIGAGGFTVGTVAASKASVVDVQTLREESQTARIERGFLMGEVAQIKALLWTWLTQQKGNTP